MRIFILLFILSLSFFAKAEPQKIIIRAGELKNELFSSFLDVMSVPCESRTQTLSSFLKNEKGIMIKSLGGENSLSTLSIRGVGPSKAEHLLIMIDGMRLNTAQGSGVDISKIPLSFVEKIEVIRGGESALYGADAVGGVINIVTRKDASYAEYAFSKKSWEKEKIKDHRLSLTTGENFRNLHFLLNLHSFQDKGDYAYQNPFTEEKEKRTHNEALGQGGLSKITWNPKDTLSFVLMEEVFFSKQNIPEPLLSSFSYEGHQRDSRSLTELRGELRLPNEKALSLELPFRFDRRYYKNLYEKANYKNYHVGPKASFSFPFSDQHFFQMVGEITHDKLVSLSHSHSPQKTNWGLALKDDFFVTPQLTLSPVGRFDFSKGLYQEFNPKLGITYLLTPFLTLKSNASQSFRSPSFDELYIQLGSFKGNPSLKPETSWDGDIGLTLSKEEWKIEQVLFGSYIKNLITYTPETTKNLAEGKIWGTELSFESKLPLLNHFYEALHYTWLKTELPYRPAHVFHSSLKWIKDPVEIFVGHQMTSPLLTPDPKRPKLQAAGLTDVGLTFFLNRSLSIQGKIENLFDRAYERVAFYPMPGRTFSLNLFGTL